MKTKFYKYFIAIVAVLALSSAKPSETNYSYYGLSEGFYHLAVDNQIVANKYVYIYYIGDTMYIDVRSCDNGLVFSCDVQMCTQWEDSCQCATISMP